jgi:hypothetical protein
MPRPRASRWLAVAAFLVAVAPVRAHHTVFDYRVNRFEADGNGFGPADGVLDFVDEFDDGVLAPSWAVVSGTATESGGQLHLTSPGTHYSAYDLSEAVTTTTIADGGGNFTVDSVWEGAPKVGDFVHMTLFLNGGPTNGSWEFFGILIQHSADQGLQIVQHHGFGFSPSEVEAVPLASSAIVGPIRLRIVFDDATNQATTAYSLDGGTTFASPFAGVPVFDGPTSGMVLLGADPQAGPNTTGGCGNRVVDSGEQCDIGRTLNDQSCCTHACQLVDADTDGICDPHDNCPGYANPTQDDNDADGIGNVCDACVAPGLAQRAWRRPLVALYRLNDLTPGDEKLHLRGRFPLAPGAHSVDPMATGAHIQIRSLHGEPPIDLDVPAGAMSASRVGWKRRSGRTFVFSDRRRSWTGGGVRRMVVRALADGSVSVSALAPRGFFNFGAQALPPLQAGVALGNTTQACGEVIFPLHRCASRGGRKIVCR